MDEFRKMEGLMNKRVDKRVYEQSVEDGNGSMPQQKKPKLPALASVVVEALKVDTLQRFCSSLEPLLRRIVSEEVERALEKLVDGKLDGRSSPPRLQGPEGKTLQLHFRTRMPPHLFTGGKVEGERGASIDIVLLDLDTGNVVQSGPESAAKLSVVVLKGDFNEEDNDDWTAELFESHEVKEREGKRPLLTGDLQVSLEQGVGTLGDLTFTDNSSWIRSRKFRLGVKVAAGYCEGIRIREAKTEGFAVKDHRGELYKKHYPPVLHDEVWRLDRIAKDGALHKKLMKAEIVTVEDFLRLFVRDQQRLRNILGSGMSNRMWENTVEHAKTCVLGGKLYVYYADDAHGSGAVFSHIYELRGIIADGNFFPLESLSHDQKVSVDLLVKRAYENWGRVVEYDGTVLNFAAARSNRGTETSAVAAAVENHVDDQYSIQSQEQDRYISDLSLRYENENTQQIHQLIEFPFMRADTTDANAMVSTYLSEDCYQQRDEHEMDDFFSEEIIRSRSSQMLESDDMQRLLKTVGFSALGHSTEASYYHSVPYEPPMYGLMAKKQCQSSGKAVVGWLKLKAALRWGIFVRKKAAERRAQLIELD